MDEKTRTRLDLHRDDVCSRAIYSLCFNLGAAMSRPFRVGDLVKAESQDNKLAKGRITKTGRDHVRVNGIIFKHSEVLRIDYDNQFEPWKPGHLVTIGAETINKLSDLEIDAMSISNCAIRRMMKGQQA